MTAGEVARLVEQLGDARSVRRDAAVARLRVMGTRAVPALVRVADSSAPPLQRSAALAALEGTDDPRALKTAQRAVAAADTNVAIAAVAVLRSWLNHERGTDALEALTVVTLDRERDGAVRLAALDALSDLPPHLVAPIRATSALETSDTPPDDPTRALAWLASRGTHASLSGIHEALGTARDAERLATTDARRDEWLRVRGAAHVLLSRRGSRLALYDLRDTLGAATRPLPLDFLTALSAVGDDTCLEALARAWSLASAEPWWQSRLVETAADIIGRCGITGRHAAVRRLREKWPTFPVLAGEHVRPKRS
jgi:HEAT repeat protein